MTRLRYALLAPAFALLLAACGEGAADAIEPETVRPARIETVAPADPVAARRFPGRVEAVRTVDLSFRVGGRIAELGVREGETLPAGTLLARLDETDYARAVREAEIQLDLARQDLVRKRTLRERQHVPEAVYDQARAEHDLRAVALDEARQNRTYTRLTAPFDTLVTRRMVEAHTDVEPGAPALRVQDVSEVRIAVNLPESVMPAVLAGAGARVEASLPTLGEQTLPLEYREHATEPDATTQTYRVVFGTPRPPGVEVLPGMVARVTLSAGPGGGPAAALSVPAAALVTDADGGFHVWRVTSGQGDVTRTPVTIDRLGQERVVVTSGLEQGARIVAAGAAHLREGMRVRPMDGY